MLDGSAQQTLLNIARRSIANQLQANENGQSVESGTEFPEEFQKQRATFVTLKKNNQLRGCIGNLEANSSLIDSVIRNAQSAAFHDPRFPALDKNELDTVVLSISILTPRQVIEFTDENDLLTKLRPGIDGLVIESGNKRSTFLPVVWENLPKAEDFLKQLKLKAGMTENETIENAWIYQAESISE